MLGFSQNWCAKNLRFAGCRSSSKRQSPSQECKLQVKTTRVKFYLVKFFVVYSVTVVTQSRNYRWETTGTALQAHRFPPVQVVPSNVTVKELGSIMDFVVKPSIDIFTSRAMSHVAATKDDSVQFSPPWWLPTNPDGIAFELVDPDKIARVHQPEHTTKCSPAFAAVVALMLLSGKRALCRRFAWKVLKRQTARDLERRSCGFHRSRPVTSLDLHLFVRRSSLCHFSPTCFVGLETRTSIDPTSGIASRTGVLESSVLQLRHVCYGVAARFSIPCLYKGAIVAAFFSDG